MDDREILKGLEELVIKLGIELIRDEGDFAGGLCRVKDQDRFILNRTLPVSQQVGILCRDLSTVDLSSIFVLPVLRERIRTSATVRTCSQPVSF